jgi:basic membrane protein A
VITVTPTNVGTWDPAQRKAFDAASAAGGWNLEMAEAVPYGDADRVLDQWGAEGVNVVFSTDNGYEENLLAAAAKYPDTAWVMMSALSTTKDLPNVASYSIDWCQYGYLQGAIAGLVTSDQKIGAVGSIDIIPLQLAMAAGKAGADAVNPGTEIITKNTGDFIDAQKGQAVAAGLVADGADVITAPVHGGISAQIAAQAQKDGVYYVGAFADESASAPEAVVSSVYVDFLASYTEAVDSWMNGTFNPSLNTLGVADGGIDSTPLTLGFEGKQPEVDTVKQQLANAEVVYPEGPCKVA